MFDHSMLKEFLDDLLNFIDAAVSFFFLKPDILVLIFRFIKFVANFYSGSFMNPPFDSVVTFNDPQLLCILLLLLKLFLFNNEGGLLNPVSEFSNYFEAFLYFYSYILFESMNCGLFISFLIFYVLLILLKIFFFYWLLND